MIKSSNTIWITAVSFALLAGISGIISGIGLIHQGNRVPDTLWVSFIGSKFENYLDTAYSVFTVVPSFYWTGLLAVITSIISTVLAIKYLHTEHGPSVMLILVIIQALVGGGWVPDLGIATVAMAKGINSPLDWWRKHISAHWMYRFSRVWPWSLFTYWVLSGLLLLFTLFGVNDAAVLGYVYSIAGLMIIPIPFMVLGAVSSELLKY